MGMGCLLYLLTLSSLTLSYAVGGDVCVSGHDSGPVFEEEPSSLIYPEGLTEGKVTLTCQARASPAAIYRWRVNGTDVLMGEDSHYTLVAGNLVINSPVYGRDGGSYQCLAINRCGTIVSRAANLKFGYLHDFPPDSRSPQTAYEGAGTFLACQPPAHYPALSYRWFVNEFPSFIQPDGGRWFVSQVTGNLYLAQAKANDTGNFFCFTTINMDISTKSIFSKAIQLTVQPDANPRKSAPNIRVRFPSETYALAGHTTQLECFAYGNPVPKLRWRKVDGVLPSKVGASAEGPILTLPDLGFADEGMYECEAYNSEGRDTHQGRISVQAQPEWLQVMSDSEVEISSDLHWSCIAAGKPRPTIHWLRNGQPLSTQDRVGVNNGHLKVSNLALEDSGMYQCVAENKHGTIYSNAELRVQVQAPDFRRNPVRRLVPAARGGQVMMECRPRAAPKPTLFWSRGTELLTNSSRVTVTPDGILWIYNISRSDEGKYTCFAENYLGKANSTGHLSVRDATKITLAPSNADINQGENVTLQCHASHDPTMDLTFTWSLNGVLLDLEELSGHYHRMEGKETIGDLVIVNGQLGQAGTYTCSAQTVVDSAAAAAKLVVRGPPGPPGGLVVKNVNETAVELRWSRGYDNHSPIGKYIIMGRSAHTQDWKRMRTDPPNIEGNAESARVIGLRPWMDYEFQVIASNILGSGEPSMASQIVRTKQAAPTVAPSGLGGGGGDRNELIITWTPMAREYQNGDAFGYILAFRKRNTPTWMVRRVPNVESSRYVYSNQSLSPYCPFEVQIKAYNRKGEGPFSQMALVHSAEEEPTVSPRRINATALTAFEIQVSWDPVQHLTTNGILRGYEIRYWRQHEREAAADRVRTAGLENTARVAGLRPSTLYHVTVLAYNSAGTGPPSPRTTAVTRKPPPNRPPGNISWKTDGSWVTVRWDHVKAMDNESAVLGYKVLYKHEGQSALKVLDKGKTSVSLPLPKDNGYVVLEIRSWGEGGDGAAHETIVSRDSDATKITLAPSNADINQGENVTLQCHASHDPTMDLTFTWSLNGVLLDLEELSGHYHRMEGKETIGDLVIVNGQLGQAGTYTCSAQTVVDSAAAAAKLVVRGPPGPPGGLVVKNVNETAVELRWSRGYDNHSPIGKYIIMGRSAHTQDWKRMRTDPPNIEGNAESARVIGLRPWMDYEFQVIASNILGSGEPSMASQIVRTKQAAPTVAPSGLGGGGGDRNELIITWTPMAREYQNGDAFGYILAFRKQNTPTWMVRRVPNVESSRYVYSNQSLSPYCPFEVQIKAYNRKGEGPFSQMALVHSAEEEPTVSPRRINATALTAFEIQVSWDPVQHLTTNGILRGYEIRYWRQHEREAAADRVRTAGLENTARVAGLRPSTLYHVTVLAYNSAGTGPPSPRTTAVTRKPPPNRPPGNISWKTDGSWVTVRWDHVKAMDNESAVLGYKVLYKHEGQSALKVLDKGKTSVSLPLPKDNGYVVLEIRSWGEGGDGAAHETIVSRDSDATKITLAPSNADINQGENVTLQCHASHDPTMDLTFTWSLNGVLLDLEELSGHYHRMEGKETIGDLVIVNGQLGQAGTYTCSAQTVVDSAAAAAKLVVRGPPGPPGGLVVKNVNETAVELRWSRGYDNHSPIGKYIIMGRSAHTQDWKRMRTDPPNIEGNAESARVIGLRPWMDYEFQVIASNILGSGEPSMASQIVRTKQAAPTVAPSGLGGGGGDRNELIITWTPMAREYQNGDAFGYILAFRKQNTPTWMVRRVPNVESSRYVYSNQSLSPYCPFEVQIKAYNRKGEGPFSQMALVHSAEEEPTVSPRRINATALTAFEIQVSWDPVQHLTTNGILRGYEIRYWRQHEREAAADRVRTAGLENTARVAGLRPSTLYHVTVLAYNSAGTGPPSPRTTAVTRKPPPNRPPGNISWKTDGSWVTVRWDHVKAMDNESAVLGYKVLYKHEGQSALKVLDKGKTSVSLPLPKDNGYVVLEIRSWGEGGDGAAHETIVSRDSGTGMMVQNKADIPNCQRTLVLLTAALLLTLIGLLGL